MVNWWTQIPSPIFSSIHFFPNFTYCNASSNVTAQLVAVTQTQSRTLSCFEDNTARITDVLRMPQKKRIETRPLAISLTKSTPETTRSSRKTSDFHVFGV